VAVTPVSNTEIFLTTIRNNSSSSKKKMNLFKNTFFQFSFAKTEIVKKSFKLPILVTKKKEKVTKKGRVIKRWEKYFLEMMKLNFFTDQSQF